MKVFVQFSDDKSTAVSSVFASPQDPSDHPNQAEIEDDDSRYLAFIQPPAIEPITAPLDKLKAFLVDNPDVAAILK